MDSECQILFWLDKCHPEDIPSIFQAIPEARKQDGELFERFFVKCPAERIPNLFQALPEAKKLDGEIIDRFLDKCSPQNIPGLLEQMPEAQKQDGELFERFFDKCHPFYMQGLIDRIPEGKKQDVEFFKRFFDKCEPTELIFSFRHMLVFRRMPEAFLSDKDFVIRVINRLPPTQLSELEQIRGALPPALQQDPQIQEACESKDVMSLNFGKRNRTLLFAAFRLLLGYLVIIAPLETVLWYATRSGKMMEFRSNHWVQSDNFAKVHFDVMPGCNIAAAPQPFGMSVVMDSTKLLVLTATLGFTARNLSVKKGVLEEHWKRYLFVVMITYTFLMIPITLISVVAHSVVEINKYVQGFQAKYVCFYAFLNMAPFQTNYIMYFVQFCCTAEIGRQSSLDCDLYRRAVCCETTMARELYAPLLDQEVTLGSQHQRKVASKWYFFLFTLLPFLILEIPFVLTHKLRALLYFLPFVMILIFISLALFVLINIQAIIKIWKSSNRSRQIIDTTLDVEQAGYLPLIPLIWGLNVINQFLTLASIYYWQNNEGWYGSAMTVLVERSMWTYMMVFGTGIMSKYWSCISVINSIS